MFTFTQERVSFKQPRHEIWEAWRPNIGTFQGPPCSHRSWLRDRTHRCALGGGHEERRIKKNASVTQLSRKREGKKLSGPGLSFLPSRYG